MPAPEEESVIGVIGIVGGPGNYGVGSCTGAMIADNVVLTAKHCVQDPEASGPREASRTIVLLGPQLSEQAPRLRVKSVVTTPGAYAENIDREFIGNDVAVITLAEPSGLKALPMKLTSPADEVGKPAVAIGYGQRRGKSPQSPTLQAGVKYRVDTRVSGVSALVIQVDDTTCQGDSGGPLLNEKGEIIGVVSYGPGSPVPGECTNGPGFYNRIDIHRQMILDAIAAAGDCGNESAEVCDGFDNDCDGKVDENCADDGAACTDDLDCKGRLCAETGAGRICTTSCDPHARTSECASGLVCIPQSDCSGVCGPGKLGDKPFGTPCTADLECETGFCHDPGTGNPVCLTTCTGGASMCLFGEACVASEGSCGTCVETELVSGKRGQDEACSDAEMCKSGLCFADGASKYCAEACLGDGDCDSAHHCREKVCVRGPRPSLGGRCLAMDDCGKGQFCAKTAQGQFCSQRCTADADCGPDLQCTALTNGRACLPKASVLGGPCATDGECLTGMCSMRSKTCTKPCNGPTDCGAGLECVRSERGEPGLCMSATEATISSLSEEEPAAPTGPKAMQARSGGGGGGCSVSQRRHDPHALVALAALALFFCMAQRRYRA